MELNGRKILRLFKRTSIAISVFFLGLLSVNVDRGYSIVFMQVGYYLKKISFLYLY